MPSKIVGKACPEPLLYIFTQSVSLQAKRLKKSKSRKIIIYVFTNVFCMILPNLCEFIPGDEAIMVHIEQFEGHVSHLLLLVLLRHSSDNVRLAKRDKKLKFISKVIISSVSIFQRLEFIKINLEKMTGLTVKVKY